MLYNFNKCKCAICPVFSQFAQIDIMRHLSTIHYIKNAIKCQYFSRFFLNLNIYKEKTQKKRQVLELKNLRNTLVIRLFCSISQKNFFAKKSIIIQKGYLFSRFKNDEDPSLISRSRGPKALKLIFAVTINQLRESNLSTAIAHKTAKSFNCIFHHFFALRVRISKAAI